MAALCTLLPACAKKPADSGDADASLTEPTTPPSADQLTHELAADAKFYNKQYQETGPDGQFAKGTKVMVVQKEPTYSRVITASGGRGWVSNDLLAPVGGAAAPTAVPTTAPATAPAP